ncbi:hypothetical protein PHYPSEUDO_005224 [Phytophthora pseudosyringae]|uniref:Uncharacterized protein n=1 Tax=Phytophthora pseudosyringae TaxID=221518 RepID=A0A8T1WDI6_9STRA|nr:hypothetical protein PHYPSEUDO_005224 [Phytophthora pseudosyringae]
MEACPLRDTRGRAEGGGYRECNCPGPLHTVWRVVSSSAQNAQIRSPCQGLLGRACAVGLCGRHVAQRGTFADNSSREPAGNYAGTAHGCQAGSKRGGVAAARIFSAQANHKNLKSISNVG